MTKFKKHKGQLFRMLDKPVPLAPDSKLPCLVRLIQDDSRMGMFNRDTKPSRLSDFYLVARIVSNNIVVDEFIESDYNRFEIIGYPVAEDSHLWALYSAMNGKSFVHKDAKQCRIFTMFSERELRVSDGEGETVEYVEIDEFLNDAAKDGWQLYEPKPEPEQKPFPSFEVGDWVEYNGGFGRYIGRIDAVSPGGSKVHIYVSDALGLGVDISCLRKLYPSEVIVHIGCLSGTVRPVSTNGIHIWFHLIGINRKTIATIRISCLDTETRELVEGLLKAQKIKKTKEEEC